MSCTHFHEPDEAQYSQAECDNSDVLEPLGVVDEQTSDRSSNHTTEYHQSPPQTTLFLHDE